MKAFALLQQFHAGRHGRLVLFLQQFVVIRLRLLVTAGEIRQLLLAYRFLIQPRLVIDHLGFQIGDPALAVGNFGPVRLELALQLHHRRRGIARRGRGIRIGCVFILRAFGFQARHHLVAHLFRLRDLLFDFAYIGMLVRIVRAQIGQLRPKTCQLGFDCRQALLRAAGAVSLGSAGQGAVLVHQSFQIDPLLLRGIERVFLGLQLRLQPR